jgi:uncharacterized ferredoxin-like protein
MPIDFDIEFKKKALSQVAEHLALAARTAPKTRGRDDLVISILTDEEKERVASELELLFGEREKQWWWLKRDADSVRKSAIVILFSIKGSKPRNLDCGACGFPTCAEFEKAEKKTLSDFAGPNCVYPLIDLGLALGASAKLCSELGVDNRIMFSIGLAARKIKIMDADIIMGLPLSATGKNIYFDRPRPQ